MATLLKKIIEGTTEDVSQFILLLKSIYSKNCVLIKKLQIGSNNKQSFVQLGFNLSNGVTDTLE
jgi:hypothetical protein